MLTGCSIVEVLVCGCYNLDDIGKQPIYAKKETAHGLFLKCLFNNHINESIHFVGLIWGQASNARTEKVL